MRLRTNDVNKRKESAMVLIKHLAPLIKKVNRINLLQAKAV